MDANFIGIDLFAGAGGLSLGAEMAGVEVAIAVEKDPFAAQTYSLNHPLTVVLEQDITDLTEIPAIDNPENKQTILFGGPPCQGFSTSNRRTWNRDNPKNWLYQEFIRGRFEYVD
ncbi:MAG: DNA cytosine methyltransferase [Oscillospiraceae bacterium]|nr:DNA cytosine methyltransferase [Oscillospiraceae bacterium]